MFALARWIKNTHNNFRSASFRCCCSLIMCLDVITCSTGRKILCNKFFELVCALAVFVFVCVCADECVLDKFRLSNDSLVVQHGRGNWWMRSNESPEKAARDYRSNKKPTTKLAKKCGKIYSIGYEKKKGEEESFWKEFKFLTNSSFTHKMSIGGVLNSMINQYNFFLNRRHRSSSIINTKEQN